MLRCNKKFVLSSEAENMYGFKVLTNGVDLSRFKNNPIMLWMHSRSTSGSKDEVLPLGFWDDIKVANGKITAVPVFDDNDSFALSIYNKVEAGILRMASAGLIPVEWDKNNKELVKSMLQEVSIVSFGANPEALSAALYSTNSSLVNLSNNAEAGKPIHFTALLNQVESSLLAESTWDDLHKNNQLEKLYHNDIDLFKAKFRERFGKEFVR